MPLISITGLSGTGKSTVHAALKARGFETYDGDEDHLAQWFNLATGLPVEVNIEDCTPDFLDGHSRDISREIVEDLAIRAENKFIFLCGAHENEGELQDLFTGGIFGLILPEDIREDRLVSRTNNPWGKLPHEREYSLAFKRRWYENCKRFGYILLDATQPPDILADQIIERSGAHLS